MAKTELTRAIESSILNWHPAKIGDIKINKFRSEHTALEVPSECGTTRSGIVDAVRVSEYFGDLEKQFMCRVHEYRKKGFKWDFQCPLGHDMNNPPHNCDMRVCRWNCYGISGTPKILLTCFEIKVSKSDFKSKHGHNFIGNMNYYVVPNEMFDEIVDLVPEWIGILSFINTEKYIGLRTKRKPTFREMSDEDQKWMILSVMKRIRDMDFEESIKLREELSKYKTII